MIEIKGPVRIYFNKPDEFPRVACIGAPDKSWELCCARVEVYGAHLKSAFNPDAVHPVEPKWWLEGRARVEVNDNGWAYVYPLEERS